jgi:flagellar protein FlbD
VIALHKLHGEPIVLNAELIESIESTPDTLITLVDPRRVLVTESVDEVVDAVVGYRRRVMGAPGWAAVATAVHDG